MREVAPVLTKVAVPVAQDTVDDGAEVELSTEGVKHGAAVDARDGERGLVLLEGVGVLGGLHRRIHHGVKLHRDFIHLDGLDHMEHHLKMMVRGKSDA